MNRMAAPGLPAQLRFAESLIASDTNGGLLAFDRAERCIYASGSLRHLLDVEAAVGRLSREILLPLIGPVGCESVSRALRNQAGAVHARLVPFDGLVRALDVHYAPLLDNEDAVTGAALMLRDVTEPLTTAAKLSETERRFQNMADASPVLLWMSREDGMCTFFNQSWLDFTGRSLEDEWGVGWAEGVHYEDLATCLDTYMDAFNARRSFEMEYRLRRADGVYRWILDRGVPRYADDGTFSGFIGSCVDITEKKIVESDLRETVSAKDQFLGMISHEMRTPLMAVQLQLSRLKQGPAFSDRQYDALRRVEIATNRLERLVESALQYSRSARGRLRAQITTFDLETLVHECVEEQRPAADEKGLQLHLVNDNPAPIDSDPGLVRSIVSNLLHNAVKFTDRGSINVRVHYREGVHCITVCDTGRGIPQAEQSRIFEPFEQLEPSSHKHTPGVGLGLALVKSMAAELGAQLKVESQPGVGSTFSLRLPQSAWRKEA